MRRRAAAVLLSCCVFAAACGGGDADPADVDTGGGGELIDSNSDTDESEAADSNGADSGDGVSNDEEPAEEPATTTTTTSTTSTVPEATYPIEFATGLPAGGTYGVWGVTVERFVLDTVRAGQEPDGSGSPTDDPNVFVEVTIENFHEAQNFNFDASLFSLTLADGTEIRASAIGTDLRRLAPLLAIRDWVSFEPLDPVTTLEGAVLTMGIDQLTLGIAEDGTVLGDAEPVAFPLSGSGDSRGVDIGACTQDLTTTLTGGQLRVNSQVTTFDDIRSFDIDSHRATDGTVFLVVQYDVLNRGGSILCGGKGGPPQLRLVVDGLPLGSLWGPSWQNDVDTVTSSEAAWEISPDVESLELVVGVDPSWSVVLDPAVVFAELPS